MSENEKPVIGTTEAAVLTCVELIARAAQMSEQHLAYWLDLYYQIRSRHEENMTPRDISELMVKVEETEPVNEQLDRIEDKVNTIFRRLTRSEGDIEKIRSTLAVISVPSRTTGPTADDWKRANSDMVDAASFAMANIAPPHAPASVLTATLDDYAQAALGRKIAQTSPAPTEKTAADVTDNDVGSKTENAAGGEPSPVLRGRETIKLQENAKAETRSEAARKQKAEEKAYKMKVADLLRDARARGVKVPGIVQASGGKLTDGAVLSILAGEFRPIADYRALAAALDKLAGDHNN